MRAFGRDVIHLELGHVIQVEIESSHMVETPKKFDEIGLNLVLEFNRTSSVSFRVDSKTDSSLIRKLVIATPFTKP